MKKWTRPQGIVEQFEANEYVAACWGVACDTEAANNIEKNNGTYIKGHLDHTPEHCGTSGNQVIYDDNNDGTADRMVEVGTDGLGNLRCTISGSIADVKPGQTIYWTTSAGDKTWHHVGTVFKTVPNHPNRS